MPQNKTQFNTLREHFDGSPELLRRRSTVVDSMVFTGETTSYIIETMRNQEGSVVFLQIIGANGGEQLVLPSKVVTALYAQQKSITDTLKSNRARKAAQTRKERGVVPFAKKATTTTHEEE